MIKIKLTEAIDKARPQVNLPALNALGSLPAIVGPVAEASTWPASLQEFKKDKAICTPSRKRVPHA